MTRFVNILLMLLVVIAFFFGVNAGKTIQKIDTPIQIQYKTKKIVSNPSIALSRHLLSTCGFSFVTPNSILVEVSSQSATLKSKKEQMIVSCSKDKKAVTVSGSTNLLDAFASGFDTAYSVIKVK